MIWGPDHWSALASVVTALAACLVGLLSWRGLNTWKTELVWQQGRGLAVSLLGSAGQIRNKASAVRRNFAFSYDEQRPLQDSGFQNLVAEVQVFVAEFDALVDTLESQSVEARILWDISFDEQVAVFRDSAHSIRGFLFGGAGSMNPTATKHEREQSRATMSMFHDEIFGFESVYKKMNAAVLQMESLIRTRLPR